MTADPQPVTATETVSPGAAATPAAGSPAGTYDASLRSPCTFTYAIGYPEFYEAMRQFLPRTRPWAWVLLGILSLTFLLVLVLMFTNPFHVESNGQNFQRWMFPIAIIYLLFCCIRYATRFRRAWRMQPQLALPHSFTADETGVSESWQSTTVQTGWQNITRWFETSQTLVIASNLGLFILPKKQIPPAVFQHLLTLLATHKPNPTGGFPVEPTVHNPPGPAEPSPPTK